MSFSHHSHHHSFAEELQAVIAALIGGAKYGIKIRLPHALVMTMLFRNDLSSKEKLHSIIKMVFEHASNLGLFATIYKIMLASLKRASRYLRHHPTSEKRLGRMLLSVLVDGPFSKNSHSILLPAIPSMAGHPERPYHALISGAVGGYFVWGRYSSVNYQIVLYLTSRVLIGLTKRLYEHYHDRYNKRDGSKDQNHHSITGGNGASGSTNNTRTNKSSIANSANSILQHPQTYPILASLVWGCVMVLFEESPHVLHKSLKASMDEIYRYQLSSMDSSSISDTGEDSGGDIIADGGNNDTTNRVNLTI